MDILDWKEKLEQQQRRLAIYRRHWINESPAAFMSKESIDALDKKLPKLSVNWPRLVVQSIADRLAVKGFRQAGKTLIEARLLTLLDKVNLQSVQGYIHTDFLLYGAAYATTWTAANGQPILLADSPMTATANIDPATNETLSAARYWRGATGLPTMAVMDSESITRYESKSGSELNNAFDWKRIGEDEHSLGAVPTVPFIRRESSDDLHGSSVVVDVLELTDANSKALGDAMVSSEYYSKPRRWATGLEIREDEEGKPIDPFGKMRMLQSEDPETKFGQLPASSPSGQTELIATLTQQIGSLTGLPPHYLGLHGDQPASAEGIRAAETQLVTKAYREQKTLSQPWQEVIERLDAISENRSYDHASVRVVWEPAEVKTPAQAADAAQKLRAIGVPLESLLTNPLDYSQHEIGKIVEAATKEQALAGIAGLRA